MASVFIPFLYVIIVFGGLYVFSHIYRRKLASQSPEPYFPPHTERNTYITLLQQNAPETTLKAALVRRAVADVKMVIRVREDKAALQLLLQKGTVGDDLWNSCLAAEKELEAEIYEVISEANSYVEGWGQLIFPTANEVIANERYRAAFDKTNEVKAQLAAKYGFKPRLMHLPPPVGVAATPAAPSSHGQANESPRLTTPLKPVNGNSPTTLSPGAPQNGDVVSDSENGAPKTNVTTITPSPSKSLKKNKKRR